MSVFFKVKNTKRSNPEARTTLDAIHNQHITHLLDENIKKSFSKHKFEQLFDCDYRHYKLMVSENFFFMNFFDSLLSLLLGCPARGDWVH